MTVFVLTLVNDLGYINKTSVFKFKIDAFNEMQAEYSAELDELDGFSDINYFITGTEAVISRNGEYYRWEINEAELFSSIPLNALDNR